MKKVVENIIIYTLILIGFIFLLGSIWVSKTFGNVSYDETLFHLIYPLNGSDVSSYFIDGIKCILIPAIIISVILFFIFEFVYKKIFNNETNKNSKFLSMKSIKLIICIVIFLSGLICIVIKLDLVDFAKSILIESDFIEDNYVEPDKVDIKFPEKKRNLIYIFMESMESSYATEQEGGILEHNLIPNLTNIANKNISFSNTEKLGGALATNGTTWTIASMVSHFSGIPFKLTMDRGAYGKHETFLPGVTNLGDILEKEGYNQMFILGSDAKFGSRDSYMKQHGDFDIFDYVYAAENGYYNGEFVWWGYDDSNLYTFAKNELIKLSKEDKPFNLTLLTVDTHFEDGYLSDNCTDLKYDDQYSNVISCADTMVYDFINWVKKQDFYENTTIVIVGDHHTMDVDFFDDYTEKEQERRIYNAYINSAISTDNIYNREFSTMDLFPTTLASLGVQIEGDRLGLGTNLFSDNETIIEKYGIDFVNNELDKKSEYYNNKFLFNIEK